MNEYMEGWMYATYRQTLITTVREHTEDACGKGCSNQFWVMTVITRSDFQCGNTCASGSIPDAFQPQHS